MQSIAVFFLIFQIVFYNLDGTEQKKKNDWQHFTITTEVYGWIGVGTDDEIRHTLHTGNHSFSVKNHTLSNPGCSELNVNSKDMHSIYNTWK